MSSHDVSRLQEQKVKIEEELMRTERQIYELEGEYLQETLKDGNVRSPRAYMMHRCDVQCQALLPESSYSQMQAHRWQVLRGWDGYLGKPASSGAIRRINRFREADRMCAQLSSTQ